MSNFAELKLVADTKGLDKGVQSMERVTKSGARAEKSVDKLGKEFVQTGNQASIAGNKIKSASIATTAMRGAAIKAGLALAAMAAGYVGMQAAERAAGAALKFKAALREVSTLITGTPEQMRALASASRDLSSQFGGSATAQVQAYYQAISAGAAGIGEASVILSQANKLAIGGVTDVTTAVNGLTTAVNVYAAEGLTAAQASDSLFVAMKAGKTTVGELSSSLGIILPISQAAGVSFDETAAAVAALTKGGISTSVAVTALRSVLAQIINPTKEASDAAKKLNVDFSASGLAAKGLGQFMDDLVIATGGSKDELTKLFGSIESLPAVFGFAGAAGESYAKIMRDMGAKTGETDKAFLKISEGMDQRLKVVLGKVLNAAIDFGTFLINIFVPTMEAVIAVVSKVTGFVSGLVKAFSDWAESADAIQLRNAYWVDFNNEVERYGNILSTLEGKMNIYNTQSLQAAKNLLAYTVSQRAATAADIAATEAKIRGSDTFLRLLRERAQLRAEFTETRKEADLDITSQFEIDKMKALALAIVDADQYMAQLLSSTDGAKENLAGFDSVIDQIQAAIAQATEGVVVFGESTGEATVTAEQLSATVGNINFSKSVIGARALAAELEVSLQTAMKMMGLVGALAQAQTTPVVFDPRDPRYDKAQAESAAKIERLRKIMGDLTKEATQAAAAVTKVERASGKAGSVGNVAAANIATALTGAKSAAEGLAGTISGTMGAGFRSMVDGTKTVSSAFRVMARDIIAQLFDVLVVKRLVGSVGTATVPGTGLAGLLGGIFAGKSFEGGGFTGPGARSGGLDGRGGFPAILHPNETVIDHTRGSPQRGGTIVIEQNLNFSVGIAQTVRAEVMSMMPQIAEVTKGAVLDARQRGGSFARGMGG